MLLGELKGEFSCCASLIAGGSINHQTSLNVNPVESKVLYPLVDSVRGHHLTHASLTNPVGVKNLE